MAKEDLNEMLDEIDVDILDSDLIEDNKLHFIIDKQLYRVRMPAQKELAEAKRIYNIEKVTLLSQENTLTEKKLIAILKEKQNVDIVEMRKKADELEKNLVQKNISLGQTKDTEARKIDRLKDEIRDMKKERRDLILEIAEHLAPSIENQAKDKQYIYLTAKCTEKYIEEDKKGKWEPVWSSFEEYEKDASKVAYKAIAFLTELILNV